MEVMEIRSTPSFEALQRAREPLASLQRKSEKAKQKLRPGSWQYARMEDTLRALRLIDCLLQGSADPSQIDAYELDTTRLTLNSLITIAEKNLEKTPTGTSQYSLLVNRLHALQTAQQLLDSDPAQG